MHQTLPARACTGRSRLPLIAALTTLFLPTTAYSVTNGDAYIKRAGSTWTIGSSSIEKTIALDSGKFVTISLKDKRSNRQLLPQSTVSDEFSVAIGDASKRISGSTGGWRLVGSKESKLSQGELELDVTLAGSSLEVTKSYLVHPKSSVIREWAMIRNAGAQPVKVIEPSFLRFSAKTGELSNLDFHWMTGADNYAGTWKLKNETLTEGKTRVFDSYDPFQGDKFVPYGDGVNAKIMLNDRQVWPESGWAYSAHERESRPFNISIDVHGGDKLVFLVNMNQNIGCDTTLFDPTIAYSDGETHTASKEFTTEQGKNGWRYQYLEDSKFVDLVYYAQHKQWRKVVDNLPGTPFVSVDKQHPDAGQDSARVWTAPKSGRVSISGAMCNTGNGAGPISTYGWKLCSASYAPWYAMLSKDTHQGLVIGWDYFGHWVSSFDADANGAVTAQLKIAGHKQTLAPGESMTTPKAFIALFHNDLDNAGNELLDWQYRYMWDYVRKGWFPAVRMLGYWMKGTPIATAGWFGGTPDWDSTYRKIFRVADLMRYTGGDVYHRDWGWWDKAGDWNGPDFKTSGEYLRKYDMGQLLYAFMYTVAPDSKVAKEHPEWIADHAVTMDMSMPATVDFMGKQLDSFYDKWGVFEWRNDSNPFCSRDGDDTYLLAQDQGLRRLIKGFLDRHQDCAFQPVNGGGQCAGYDYVRYGSSLQFSDGAVGILGNYYTTLLFPPDKINNMPDIWDPNNFDKATWRGLLAGDFDMTGDTWDATKLEGLREVVDIYHYLAANGVVGRWVHVFRPAIAGDDPTMYIQRMSGDGKRGIIITKHKAEGAVDITPKGLIPGMTYYVSFHDGSGADGKRTGADLMAKGFHLEKLAPGELIYLNLPMHPGSKLDTVAPTAAASLVTRVGRNMGFPGVELRWKPGSDNNWVSYYEIIRDGVVIDKVAKGTFYFDHSAGADLGAKYEVRTVDGAGNRSPGVFAPGTTTKRATVIDDTPGRGITYTGEWTRERRLQPAYNGTVSWTKEKGASAEASFEGTRVVWSTKLGADCGKAAVSIDEGSPEIVDTYSADDIWGVCVCSKDLTPGKHTIRITTLGERSADAKDIRVYIDGIRAE